MSWYDFNLYILKHEKKVELQKFEFENDWNQTRQIWTLLANIHRDPKKRGAWKPQEFIRLSFDEPEDKEPLTLEYFEHLKKRFGSTIKNG